MTSPAPIRVLVACQPLHSGVPHHVLDLVRSLDRTRYRIALACPRESILWGALEHSDVELHAISPAREPRPADLRTLVTLARLVRDADVVHGHSAKAGFLVRLAALLTGRSEPLRLHAARLVVLVGRRRRRPGSISCSSGSRRGGAARSSRSPPTSATPGSRAGSALAAAYEVIPNGVELASASRSRRVPVSGRILMVGRFAAPKRHDLVLRAFADVHARFPGSELWFVGNGDGLPAAERLAGELGVAGSTRFLGVREDVPALLAEAACVVLSSDYEGCPLSVIEAMAAGVPVVATSVGGVPEIVEDGVTGIVTAPGSTDGLARGLATLLADEQAAARMGAAGQDVAREQFSRERMAAATERVYTRIVADPVPFPRDLNPPIRGDP